MTRADKKLLVNTWTSQYAVIFNDNRWHGRLTFGPKLSRERLYTKATMDRADVLDYAYIIVRSRVLSIIGEIEKERSESKRQEDSC
jgi:hypothetical protein